MLLRILEHTLAKEMVQLFLMMWPVLGMRPGLQTANTLPSITVVTMKMLELVARLNVSFNSLLHNYVELCITELIKCTCTKIAKGRKHLTANSTI